MDKIEGLKEILEQDPKNSFARYGWPWNWLLRRDGRGASEFDTLLVNDPDYTSGYFMARRRWPRRPYSRSQGAAEGRHRLRRAQRQLSCCQRDAGYARRAWSVDFHRVLSSQYCVFTLTATF